MNFTVKVSSTNHNYIDEHIIDKKQTEKKIIDDLIYQS